MLIRLTFLLALALVVVVICAGDASSARFGCDPVLGGPSVFRNKQNHHSYVYGWYTPNCRPSFRKWTVAIYVLRGGHIITQRINFGTSSGIAHTGCKVGSFLTWEAIGRALVKGHLLQDTRVRRLRC